MPQARPPAEPDEPALRGEVVYLYAFDVASEVRLDGAPALLSARNLPVVPDSEHPAARSVPRSVPVARPVAVEPRGDGRHLGGEPTRVLVRVYEVGVVTVTVRVSFSCGLPAELLPFHSPVLDDGRPLDRFARERCVEVRDALAASLVRPEPETEPEAYTVFCLTSLGGERDANRWLGGRRREVAGLLAATPGERLSEAQVAEVLRLGRSFENTDLVVIDWEAALLVDLDGKADEVLFVLDLANLQLEEFRWMDRTLDRQLEQAYVDLSRRRRWRPGRGTAVLRSLRQLRIDLAKLADEVTHATKFIGDWHLARVYILARERFHLDQWRASVDQRLDELDRLYTILRSDVYERRMLWLEAVIVIFFALDLLIILFVK